MTIRFGSDKASAIGVSRANEGDEKFWNFDGAQSGPSRSAMTLRPARHGQRSGADIGLADGPVLGRPRGDENYSNTLQRKAISDLAGESQRLTERAAGGKLRSILRQIELQA